MNISMVILQVLLLLALAPLVSGVIRKVKNNIRLRRGPGVLQPYYNLSKLFSKGEVISENASWIFRAAPYVVFGSVITAAFLLPVFGPDLSFARMGDLLVILFLFSLGRFFMTLAGLDTASAFGGMGSSREMFISALVEPVALLSIFAISLNCASTNPAVISASHMMRFSTVIASMSIFIVMIAETSRIPVDNQETHLELTMVHEAMVLEYSGRSLAMIEWASHLKQLLFFTLIANVVFPFGPSNLLIYSGKILLISLIVSLLEISIAKMRLFRVVDFLSFALVLSLMAVVAAALGL